jgi:long-chain acyl-CoA synthetase
VVATVSSTELLDRWAHRGDVAVAGRTAIATYTGEAWVRTTYDDLDLRSARMAAALAAAGVESGDRVAILSEPGAGWAAAFLGILRRGAVAVPLDPKLTAEELDRLGDRSRLAAAVVSPSHRGRGPGRVPVLDPPALDPPAPAPTGEPGAEVERELQDPAVLVWTSGSTGEPKGVLLSFANLAYVVDRSRAVQGTGPDARWLSVLPPNHLLELCCGLLPALAAGSTTYVAGSIVPGDLAAMMRQAEITQMVVVPMVARMFKRHIELAGRRRRFLGAYLRAAGRLAGIVGSARARRLLFAPVHRRLGGRLRSFYCGGAPLDPAIVTFFDRLGIGVYQGYGLTETAPSVSMNSPGHNRAGSVGRPLPGTEVRIGPDGEILVRGPGVMLGYWEDEAGTREAIDRHGWLHTGDLGHIDGDGYLYVTGRAKSMIVLDTGKKVQPEEVETALARSDRFSEVCVVGWQGARGADGRTGETVCAVVVPAAPMSQSDATEEVRRLTTGLAGYKRPTVVRVHQGELPKTAKRSLRRAEVVKLLDQEAVRP